MRFAFLATTAGTGISATYTTVRESPSTIWIVDAGWMSLPSTEGYGAEDVAVHSREMVVAVVTESL
jgi:hypothetical protein